MGRLRLDWSIVPAAAAIYACLIGCAALWHFVAVAATAAEPSPVAADGAKLVEVGSGYKFTEGPACDQDGNVYFTDQPNDQIVKWSADGQLSTFLKPCGRSNGLYFDHDGTLLACADENNELWRIKMDGTHEVLVSSYEGKRLNGPNDVWVRPDGGVFFTDPYYQRDYWRHEKPELDVQGVYFFEPKSKRLVRVADDLQQPNGIVGTPDGKTLYVADIRARRTYAYDIQPDGTLGNKRLFCEMGSDGLTLDRAGNVYLTGNGVAVFNPSGQQIDKIDVPARWTANVCFGGADRKTLFITASQSVYTLETR